MGPRERLAYARRGIVDPGLSTRTCTVFHFVPVVVDSVEGLALWHAARRGQPWWFVILLVVNTVGILEIIYLFAVAKLKVNELFTKHDHKD